MVPNAAWGSGERSIATRPPAASVPRIPEVEVRRSHVLADHGDKPQMAELFAQPRGHLLMVETAPVVRNDDRACLGVVCQIAQLVFPVRQQCQYGCDSSSRASQH